MNIDTLDLCRENLGVTILDERRIGAGNLEHHV